MGSYPYSQNLSDNFISDIGGVCIFFDIYLITPSRSA